MELLTARGFDVSGFDPEQMTSADDVYFFPNLVGPIYPGSAILFRVRPDGLDPERSIKDTWVIEWPRPIEEPRHVVPRVYPDWTERNWGEITNQDYANMGEVQAGHARAQLRGPAPRHPPGEQRRPHARVIDRYLLRVTDAT